MMYFIVFAAAAIIAITIHEVGHLLAARLLGIRVLKVAIGLGPELTGYTDHHGTRWGVGLWLIGGRCDYVDEPSGGSSTSLDGISLRAKLFLYLAGSASNFLFATVCVLSAGVLGGYNSLLPAEVSQAIVLLLGLVSAFVGLFNLLPIPPLDGGQLLLTLLARMRGRQISQVWTKWLDRVGVSLMAIMAAALLIRLLEAWN